MLGLTSPRTIDLHYHPLVSPTSSQKTGSDRVDTGPLPLSWSPVVSGILPDGLRLLVQAVAVETNPGGPWFFTIQKKEVAGVRGHLFRKPSQCWAGNSLRQLGAQPCDSG